MARPDGRPRFGLRGQVAVRSSARPRCPRQGYDDVVYFPDLGSTCQVASGPKIRAIGWLDASHEFPRGVVSLAFLLKIARFAERSGESTEALSWLAAGGWHTCELCHGCDEGGNFGVPGDGVLYACPEMLVHYVCEHEYRPPDEFIRAVLASPLPGTAEYYQTVQPFQSTL
jgi:hypothetical protein